jgi:hypothetical protein
MSVSLAAKPESRECLKVRMRCGCGWCVCQRTERSEMPIALAIARPVQWVAWCGGSVKVSAIAPRLPLQLALCRACGSCLETDRQPLPRKRCCHLHTVGRPAPMFCATLYADPDPRRRARCARPLDVLERPIAGLWEYLFSRITHIRMSLLEWIW